METVIKFKVTQIETTFRQCSSVEGDHPPVLKRWSEISIQLCDAQSEITRSVSVTITPSGMSIYGPSTHLDSSGAYIVDGHIGLSSDLLPMLLDLIRSKAPIFVYLSNKDPNMNSILDF